MMKTLTSITFGAFAASALLLGHSGFAQQKVTLADSVKPFVDRSELAGAVMLVANQDKVLALDAIGWSNVGEKTAMKNDSLFWIASQSKPITGTAFMILVDEGKVSLDDPISKFLPEFSNQMIVAEKTEDQVILKKPSRPVTVRDVLSHVSGFPFKSALEEPTLDLYPLAARVRSYAMTPLVSEPGTRYQYSNAGINTAARIIEVVSGMSFEAFLDERLFAPLGMKDTTFWPNEKQAARIAQSYKPGPDKKSLERLDITQLYYPLTDRKNRFPMPAGGLFSSAEDVSKFYRLILNRGEFEGKRILSEESVKQLTTKQTPETIKNGYGLGFSVSDTTVGHGGAFSTNSFIETDSGLIYVWLVQHAGFPGKGKQAQGEFRKAAAAAFAPKK